MPLKFTKKRFDPGRKTWVFKNDKAADHLRCAIERTDSMKMKNFQTFIAAIALVLVLGVFTSCQQAGGNQTGSEFIPDMAHSVAYEANVLTNYSLNTWDEESVKSRWDLSQPGTPVAGTVPRGYAAIGSYDLTFASAEDAILKTAESMKKNKARTNYRPNGHVPYFYPDTEEGRTAATEKIIYNPFPVTDEALANGKELYTIYCAICHGDKGDGDGYIVSGPQSKYLAQPANFTDDQFVNASNGRFYHAIMYGKNVMGSHADKLSFEERWDVIHYIRSLQAKARKVKYNSEVNELNPDYGLPYAQIKEQLEALDSEGHEAVGEHSEDDTQDEQGHEGGDQSH